MAGPSGKPRARPVSPGVCPLCGNVSGLNCAGCCPEASPAPHRHPAGAAGGSGLQLGWLGRTRTVQGLPGAGMCQVPHTCLAPSTLHWPNCTQCPFGRGCWHSAGFSVVLFFSGRVTLHSLG